MRGRTWISAFGATTVAVALTVVGVGASTSANAAPPPPVAQDDGILSLITPKAATDPPDAWSWPGGIEGHFATQPVGAASATNCILNPATGPLVTLSGAAGTTDQAGFVNHLIGVTQTGTSSNCGKVNLNWVKTGTYTYTRVAESLTVQLNGAALNDPAFGPDQAKAANLDIVTVDDTNITASLYLSTSATPTVPVGTYKFSADEHQPTTAPPPGTTFCLTPDNEDGRVPTSCPWPITGGPNFDTIVLTPTSGYFSLGGGGESASASPTTFSLVKFYQQALACNSTTPPQTSTTGNFNSLTVTRLNDDGTSGAGVGPCGQPVPLTLTNDGGSAQILKPASATAAQFAITATRSFPIPTQSTTSAGPVISDLKGNWQLPGGSPDFVIPYCTGPAFTGAGFANLNPTTNVFNYTSTGPTLPHVDPIALAADGYDQVDNSILPGVQYACIYGESREITGGNVVVYDFVYLSGDFKFTP